MGYYALSKVGNDIFNEAIVPIPSTF